MARSQPLSPSLLLRFLHAAAALTAVAAAVLAQGAVAVVPPLFAPGSSRARGAVRDEDGNCHRSDFNQDPLPVVIWHGLGDNFASPGLREVGQLANAVHPNTFVYNVALGTDAATDRLASYTGNVTTQVGVVCKALAEHPVLSTAPAIDALGFSQGGQFLRAYVERCNMPPVRSLVTFGSQHNGITEFVKCSRQDWRCRILFERLRSIVWTGYIQGQVVPAQYFRDPADLTSYLESSNFLADINNERAVKNPAYCVNVAGLANLALYMWDEDSVAIPRKSSWFAEVNGSDVTPLRERLLYKEDWLGLRAFDVKGGLHFRYIKGDHMDLSDRLLKDTMAEFFGPYDKTVAKASIDKEPGEL